MRWDSSADLRRRVEHHLHAWEVAAEEVCETDSSVLVAGRRHRDTVMLKVVRQPNDEWRCGEVLKALGGTGVVPVLDWADGAVLMRRLTPGQSLVSTATDGYDDDATGVIADVIARMSPATPPPHTPTVEDWGRSFDRYRAAGRSEIPLPLFDAAHRTYARLCASQSPPRLLHGDLHHYNVLLDTQRGWVAIDPKGVIGEIEFEVGAALRNPYERPALFLAPSTIQARIARFARELRLDAGRMIEWTFAQAVLSVIWAIEDGHAVEKHHPCLALADTIDTMLGRI